MAISKVRARSFSIKLFDQIDVGKMPDGTADLLEERGLCLWLFGDRTAMVIPVRTYEAIADMLGGVAA